MFPYPPKMALSSAETKFLETQHSAAMITIGSGGVPKVVRIGVALVDGHVWSSGTQGRVRTKRLRRDPRCTLFVFDQAFSWLALETTVTLLQGPKPRPRTCACSGSCRTARAGRSAWYGNELDEPAFLQRMLDEVRLVYEFGVDRSYGLA